MVVVNDILDELYMLTGVVNKDRNYLYYLLVKDGCLFDQNVNYTEPTIAEESVSSFDDWFNQI